MPRATIGVTLPTGTWIRAVSTANPDAVFRAVSVVVGDGGATGVVEVTTDDPVGVLEDVERHPSVRAVELLTAGEGKCLIQVEHGDTRPMRPAIAAGVPVETPFEIRNGRVTWDVSTTSDHLSALRDELQDRDVEFELDELHGFNGESLDDELLTARQREVFLTALEEGYYETPRETTLTAVAETLDSSKATVSEVLHRAEGKILTRYADRNLH